MIESDCGLGEAVNVRRLGALAAIAPSVESEIICDEHENVFGHDVGLHFESDARMAL